MHGYLVSQYFGANDCVLDKVLRGAASDHKESCSLCIYFYGCQLSEIPNRIDGHMGMGIFYLMLCKAESCTGI